MTKRVATEVDDTMTTSKLVAPPRPLSLDVNASQRAQPERQVATRGLAIENSFAESLNMRFCRTKSPAMISSEGDTSINKKMITVCTTISPPNQMGCWDGFWVDKTVF